MAEQATVETIEHEDADTARYNKAGSIVRQMSAWGAGAGVIPLPVVDFAALVTVQVVMINKLSHLYGIPFREHTVKNLVGVLIGSVVPAGLAGGAVGSLIKSVPVVGQLAGVLLMPGFAAAVTWAMGRIFVQHFETGGTLLDLDAERMKEHFKAEFEAAQAKGKSR